jgi:hypothetical protein
MGNSSISDKYSSDYITFRTMNPIEVAEDILDGSENRARASKVPAIRATAGCRDVTLPASGELCAPVLALRQAQAAAERRDVLDTELREAESQVRGLPAVIASDPQADTAARLISWMSFGLITVTSNDIHLARIAGMTLVPQLAGLVLMLAATLWQVARTEHVICRCDRHAVDQGDDAMHQGFDPSQTERPAFGWSLPF